MSKKQFATIATGTNQERKIPIKNFSVVESKDGRIARVLELENKEGYILQVSNPPSSERSLNQEMWLTEKSFKMFSVAFMVMCSGNKGLDMEQSLSEIHEDCSFYASEDLK